MLCVAVALRFYPRFVQISPRVCDIRAQFRVHIPKFQTRIVLLGRNLGWIDRMKIPTTIHPFSVRSPVKDCCNGEIYSTKIDRRRRLRNLIIRGVNFSRRGKETTDFQVTRIRSFSRFPSPPSTTKRAIMYVSYE